MTNIRIYLFSFFVLICVCSTAQINRTLALNGTTDYVKVPNSSHLDIDSTQTIEVWIKSNSMGSTGVIVRKGWCNSSDESYYLGVKNGKVVWVWGTTGNCNNNSQVESSDSVISNGVCTHIAVVHTADTVNIYINGLEVATTKIKGFYSPINSSNSPLTIGTYRYKSGSYGSNFNGSIDELRIWKTARTQAEIRNMHLQAIQTADTNLIVYFQMEDSVLGAGRRIVNTSFLDSLLDGTTIGTVSSPSTDSSCYILNSDTCLYTDTTNYIVFDTVQLSLYDTLYTVIFDTTQVTLFDTTTIMAFDTMFLIDTTLVTIFDTFRSVVYDTIIYEHFDTTEILDTTYVYINDTVFYYNYITVEDTLNILVYDSGGCGHVNLVVYPNPNRDFLYIHTRQSNCFVNSKVLLIDQLGQIVVEEPFENQMKIDLKQLAQAAYHLKIVDKSGTPLVIKNIVVY